MHFRVRRRGTLTAHTHLLAIACVAILALAFLAGGEALRVAAESHPDVAHNPSPQVVRVGVYDNPPLIYQDDEGAWQGIYADILREVAAQESWQLEWHRCSWTDCLVAVSNGDLDLLAAIAYTDDRAQRMAFGQQTVLANWGQVYAQAGAKIESLLDLEGKTLVGMAQDIHWITLREMLALMDVHHEFIEVEDFQDVLDALDAGRADAGIVSRAFGLFNVHQGQIKITPIIIDPIALRFAAPPGDPAGLLADLDRHLEEMKSQPGSVYHRALERNMPDVVVTTSPRWLLPVSIVAGVLLCAVGWGAYWASRQARRRGLELAGSTEALALETTQREEAQLALEESETRYRLIFEHLSDIVCVLDPRLGILTVSPSVKPTLGYAPSELVGRSMLEFLHPSVAARAQEAAGLVLAGETLGAETYPLTARDGSPRYAEVVAAPLVQPGEELRIILVARDITARLEAEEHLRQTRAQLVQAHKMESIALLAGGVAHDFNNMLTAILGHLELALLGAEQGTTLYDDLIEARRSVERATGLTRQLLLFSHQHNLEMTPTDLGQATQDMLRMLSRLIGEDIAIAAEVAPDLPPVLADAGQLQQVLMNLCLNARDAMPNGGTLSIQVDEVSLDADDAMRVVSARPGRFVRLSVTDTGVGIPDDIIERIFEPFFTTKAPGHGTGLGLSVSYAVVQDHGGWIDVYSEPGHGTTFRVYVPVPGEAEEPRGGTRGDAQQAQTLAPGHGERILLVEDEENVRRFALAALSSHGYDVCTAHDVSAALELAERYAGALDLVFSDVILPDRTGIELAAELRAKWPGLPILLASGYADRRSGWGAAEEAGYRYIPKPYGLAQLLAAVQQTLLDGADEARGRRGD